jgi:hypothetical protein
VPKTELKQSAEPRRINKPVKRKKKKTKRSLSSYVDEILSVCIPLALIPLIVIMFRYFNSCKGTYDPTVTLYISVWGVHLDQMRLFSGSTEIQMKNAKYDERSDACHGTIRTLKSQIKDINLKVHAADGWETVTNFTSYPATFRKEASLYAYYKHLYIDNNTPKPHVLALGNKSVQISPKSSSILNIIGPISNQVEMRLDGSFCLNIIPNIADNRGYLLIDCSGTCTYQLEQVHYGLTDHGNSLFGPMYSKKYVHVLDGKIDYFLMKELGHVTSTARSVTKVKLTRIAP